MNRNPGTGTLYIVATPIGNLQDITLRALEILQHHVTLIAAEDTRHSHKLLQHYAITTPTISLHEHNEEKRSQILLQRLLQGENIALISDAGTPLISDPGYNLVNLVRKHNIKVVPIPGACAAITALCAAGLPTDRFAFEGFLPVKQVALHTRLHELAGETRTIVLYEAPHRLLKLIAAMIAVWGKERRIVLAKELTKVFETIYAANLGELEEWLCADAARHQKGEFVLLVPGKEIIATKSLPLDQEAQRILQILQAELPPKQAVKLTAKITGVDKKVLYEEIKQKLYVTIQR